MGKKNKGKKSVKYQLQSKQILKIPISQYRVYAYIWNTCKPKKLSNLCNMSYIINRILKDNIAYFKNHSLGRSQDAGGIRWGDHFLPYRFIKRTIECWANFTKQLLIASWGHQVPRKAAHCLRKEVGQNIKDKKRDKRARHRDPSREGSLNRGSFQTPGNPYTGGSGGSFRISEGNLTGRKNK